MSLGPSPHLSWNERLGPSAHLSWRELACRDGTPYPLKWRADRAEVLGHEFEEIRSRVNGPIEVDSAYRPLAYNRLVPSKDTSQHVQARGLDLRLPPWLEIFGFLALVLEVARRPESRLRGIGVYNGFIHVDTRPTIRLARWRGSRSNADVVAAMKELIT